MSPTRKELLKEIEQRKAADAASDLLIKAYEGDMKAICITALGLAAGAAMNAEMSREEFLAWATHIWDMPVDENAVKSS